MERISRRRFTQTLTIATVGAALAPLGLSAATGARPASTPNLRPLGKSGLKVPGVGIGTNNFGTRMDAAATQSVVDAAMGLGATFFDTADVYGNGQSEELLGKALGARRSRAIIATKFGGPMRGSKFPDGGASSCRSTVSG